MSPLEISRSASAIRGKINIEPGTTCGWGFELNSDTSKYMLVTILNKAYNQALQQGFGEVAILPGALIGSTTGATFSVA